MVQQFGAMHSMARNSFFFRATLDSLEQLVHLVDAGKLESGL